MTRSKPVQPVSEKNNAFKNDASRNKLRGRGRLKKRAPLLLENLESRSFMAADVMASLDGNILRIEGTDSADEIRIIEDSGRISIEGAMIQDGNDSVFSVDSLSIHRISIDTLGQDDDVWVGDGLGGLSPALEIISSSGHDRLHSVDHVFATGLDDGVKKVLQFNGSTYSVGVDGTLEKDGERISVGSFALSGATFSVGDSGLLVDGFVNIPQLGMVEVTGGFDTDGNLALSSQPLQSAELLGGLIKLNDSIVTLTADGAKLKSHATVASIGEADIEGIVTFEGDYKLEGTGGVKFGSQSYDGIHFVIGNEDVAFKVPVPSIGDIDVRGTMQADGHWFIQGTYPETVFVGSIPLRNITVGIGDDRFTIGADSGIEGILDARVDGVMFYDGRFTLRGQAKALSVGSFSLGDGQVVISNDPETTLLDDKTVQLTVDGKAGIPNGPTIKLHGVVDGNGNYDLSGKDNIEIAGLKLQETQFTLKKGEGLKFSSKWNYGIFNASLVGEITSGGKLTFEGDAETAKVGDLELGRVHLKGDAEKGSFAFQSDAKAVSIGGFSLANNTVSITNRTSNGATLTKIAGAIGIPNGPKVNLTGEVDTAGNYKLQGQDSISLAGVSLTQTQFKLEKGMGLQLAGKLNLFLFNSTFTGTISNNGSVRLSGSQSSGAFGGFSLGSISMDATLDTINKTSNISFKASKDFGFAKVNFSGAASGNAAQGLSSLTLTGSASLTGQITKILSSQASFVMKNSGVTFSGTQKLPFNLGSLKMSGTVNSNGTVTIGSKTVNPSSLTASDASAVLKGIGGTATQIAGVLIDSYKSSISQVARTLHGQKFTYSAIVDAIWERSGKDLNTVASALSDANASASTLVTELWSKAGSDLNKMAKALRSAGEGYTSIVTELWSKAGKSVSKMASALKAAGASESQIIDILYNKGIDMTHLVSALGKNVSVYLNGLTKTWKVGGEYVELFKNSAGNTIERTWGGAQKYLENTWDKAGRPISRNIEALDGKWSEEKWGGAQNYLKTTWDKLGPGAKAISRITKTVDNKLINEYWNRGSDLYWKGVWKNISAGGQMESRYIKRANETISEAWDDAQNYGKTVWNAAGKQISRVGSLFSSYTPSISISFPKF